MSGDHAGAGMAQLGTDPLPLAWLTLANSPTFCKCSSKGSFTSTFATHLLDKEATKNWAMTRCPANAILVVLAIDSLTPGNAFQVVHPHTAARLVKTWRALHHLQRDENVGWLLVADVGRRSIESWHQTYYLALENNLSVSGAWCGKMVGESDCQRGGWNRTSPI